MPRVPVTIWSTPRSPAMPTIPCATEPIAPSVATLLRPLASACVIAAPSNRSCCSRSGRATHSQLNGGRPPQWRGRSLTHTNGSPKGLENLRVLGRRAVAYVHRTGSGAETMAHLRESGRILSLFCEMSAAPKIVGLHGTGPVVLPGTAEWTEHAPRFEPQAGARTIVLADIQRVGDSCGFGVPKFETVRQRRGLTMWSG